jgi:hypothetical protein
MTPQEQYAVIGQMTVERNEASREMVLLLHKLQEAGRKCSGLSVKLGGIAHTSELREALPLLDVFIEAGGLEDVRRVLNEYLELMSRSLDLEKKLKALGQ